MNAFGIKMIDVEPMSNHIPVSDVVIGQRLARYQEELDCCREMHDTMLRRDRRAHIKANITAMLRAHRKECEMFERWLAAGKPPLP